MARLTIRSLCLLAVGAGAGHAQIQFTAPIDLLGAPLAPVVSRCELADLNGDDRADLLFSGGDVVLSLSQPGGTFGPLQDLADSSQAFSGDVRFVDLDGDHVLDLLARPSVGGLAVRFGTGDGDFGPTLDSQLGGGGPATSTAQLETGDVNGDGELDVLVTTQPLIVFTPDADTLFELHTGDGSGLFSAAAPLQPEPVPMRKGSEHGFELIDLQADGDLDVVRRLATGTQDISVLVNFNGSGSFRETRFTRGADIIDAFDADGDGYPDLVFEDEQGGWFSPGRPSGRFAPAVEAYPTSDGALDALRHADLNDDGILDLLRPEGMRVQVLLGEGDGLFRNVATIQYPPAGAQSAVPRTAVVDVDGNGSQDIVGMALHSLLGSHVLAVALQVD